MSMRVGIYILGWWGWVHGSIQLFTGLFVRKMMGFMYICIGLGWVAFGSSIHLLELAGWAWKGRFTTRDLIYITSLALSRSTLVFWADLQLYIYCAYRDQERGQKFGLRRFIMEN